MGITGSLSEYRNSSNFKTQLSRLISGVKPQITSLIREDLSFAGETIASEMRSRKILGIHVRGGDFLNAERRDLVGNLTLRYYLGAVSVATSKLDFDEIWVFTNDLEYAESMFLDSDLELRFISQSDISRPSESLNLLRMCTGMVISNSSFSYLAAFLSVRSEVVVAPIYFSKATNSINGTPESWYLCESEWA